MPQCSKKKRKSEFTWKNVKLLTKIKQIYKRKKCTNPTLEAEAARAFWRAWLNISVVISDPPGLAPPPAPEGAGVFKGVGIDEGVVKPLLGALEEGPPHPIWPPGDP